MTVLSEHKDYTSVFTHKTALCSKAGIKGFYISLTNN